MKVIKNNLDSNYETKTIVKLDNDNILFVQSINNNVHLYKQNIKTKEVTKINQTIIECSDYLYPQIKVVGSKILIEIESIDSENKGIYIINLENKEEKLCYKTDKQGNVIFLNDRYALLLGQEEFDEEEFDFEKDKNGEYNYAYLIDIIENKEYEVHDVKIKRGIRYGLPMYTKNNNTYLIVEEVHMEDYEAEEIYHSLKNHKDFEDADNQSINIISLEKLIKNIKDNKQNLDYEIICKNNYNTCINYFGQKEDDFFYRTKNFDTNEETIYKVNKENLEISIVNNFNLNRKYKEEDSHIHYDKYNQIVFIENKELKKVEYKESEGIPLHEILGISKEELCEEVDCIEIEEYETVSSQIEILNKNISIKSKNNCEIPDTIIENNLISNYWIDLGNEEEFKCEYYTRVINLDTKEEKIFKNNYIIIEDMLILY